MFSKWSALVLLIITKNSRSDQSPSRFLTNFDSCFYTDDLCPNKNISFWLYSRELLDNPKLLDVTNLQSDDFNRNRTLVILIHGYTGDRDFSPNTEIRGPLLDAEDVYVVSVDYKPLVREPCYPFAVRNTRSVGRCIAQFLDNLVEKQIFSLNDIHIVGFSLGAQVAGLIANYLTSGKLKRITGLDPAKPLYNFVGNESKLDRSDAEFIDVIHTDVLERGMLLSVGHVDFYPNGGMNQPGCNAQNISSSGACNHRRAPEYYAESLNATLEFWGYSCYSWFNFVLGFCRWNAWLGTEKMGYRVSTKASGVYFLETNSEFPYARGPYPEAATKLLAFPSGTHFQDEFPLDW